MSDCDSQHLASPATLRSDLVTPVSQPSWLDLADSLMKGDVATLGSSSFLDACYQNNRLDLFDHVVKSKPVDRTRDDWFHELCTGRDASPFGPIHKPMPMVIVEDIRPQAADFMRWYVETIADATHLSQASEHSAEAASLVLQAQLEVSIARAKRPGPSAVMEISSAPAATAVTALRHDAPPALSPAARPAGRPQLRLVV